MANSAAGKTAGSLTAQALKDRPAALYGVDLNTSDQKSNPRLQSMWQQPKKKPGTYAEQYLSAYKSRWMMQSNSAVSAYRARQSVMSRLQSYSSVQQGSKNME